MTFEQIERFVSGRTDFKRGAVQRFIVSVMPKFKTVSDLYNADQAKTVRELGRRCGKATIQVWDAVKEEIYRVNAVEEAREKALADRKLEEARKQELEDPYIPIERMRQILSFMELADLKGIRYRRFLAFVDSVEPDFFKEGGSIAKKLPPPSPH